MLDDKQKPKFKNVPEQITLNVGDDFNVEQQLADLNVEIIDNVSSVLTYTIAKNNVDTSMAGEYLVLLSVTDDAGNKSEEKIKVVVNDYPVHKAYLEATNLRSLN